MGVFLEFGYAVRLLCIHVDLRNSSSCSRVSRIPLLTAGSKGWGEGRERCSFFERRIFHWHIETSTSAGYLRPPRSSKPNLRASRFELNVTEQLVSNSSLS